MPLHKTLAGACLTEGGTAILIPEPAKHSSEEAKLDLLLLEPRLQPTEGDRSCCFAQLQSIQLLSCISCTWCNVSRRQNPTKRLDVEDII